MPSLRLDEIEELLLEENGELTQEELAKKEKERKQQRPRKFIPNEPDENTRG